jgi:type VI secretion system secreted protein Hcp
VLSWSWEMSNHGKTHVGSGGGSGKVEVQDVSLTKYVDSSSPNPMLAYCKGSHFDNAVLTVRKAGGEEPVEYVQIKMTEVFITSVSTGGSGGEERLTENVTLNFAKVELDYTRRRTKAVRARKSPSVGTSLPTNTNEGGVHHLGVCRLPTLRIDRILRGYDNVSRRKGRL